MFQLCQVVSGEHQLMSYIHKDPSRSQIALTLKDVVGLFLVCFDLAPKSGFFWPTVKLIAFIVFLELY